MPVLDWLGKDKVINHHLDAPFRFLDKKFSVGSSQNKIIHGDNLLALKSLLPEFAGRVKCIYIDPPYNTGNENWIYNDAVNDPQIRRWLGQVVGKEGEDLSRHDKWLCMMYPRLRLLQKLLSADGAIFISIDDNEQANLKLICDEIFGAQNFVSHMIWKCKSGGANDVKGIACDTESILVYAKNISVCKFNKDTAAQVTTNYNHTDADGRRYSLERLDKQSIRYTDSLNYEIIGSDGKSYFPAHKNPDKPNATWRWSKETVAQRYDELIFKWPYVYTKNYEKNDGAIPRNLLVDERFGRTRSGKTELAALFDNISTFTFPKPTKLIKFLLSLATDKNSIVLDSFAGSGTTAHAVINLNAADGGNRKFILIELMDYAESITAERVKRVGGQFNFYELGETLFDDEGFINAEIPREKIFDYVYFFETQKHFEPGDEENLLGVDDGVAYYFFDEAELNFDLLAKIRTRANSYVIYAANCTLAESELDEFHITFKKIPRDVPRV